VSKEVDAPVVDTPSRALMSRPARAACVPLMLGALVSLVPGWADFRFLRTGAAPAGEAGLLNVAEQREGASEVPETTYRPELQQDSVVAPPRAGGPIAKTRNDAELPRDTAEAPPVLIADPTRSLDPFYARLTETALKKAGAITRILFHGDSMVASDYVTGTVRRKLQAQFGDSGHGFVTMADPWPSYFHNDIFRLTTRGFQVSRIVGPYATDGLYGLGGVSFKAARGVYARFGTVEKGDFGRRASVFQLYYLKQPGGGELEVNVDAEPHSVLSTQHDTFSSGVHTVEVPDGHHLFEVVTKSGLTRTFGVVLERQTPGVVLDAIGIQGARLRFLDKQDDAHWAEQLRLRDPNLIVYQFGANESGDGFAYSMEDYHVTMAAVLNQAKRAVPNAGCLVMAAMDRARKVDDTLITVPIIPHIVKEQEAVAKEVGCAFWSTYDAMGGRGSMAQWVRRGIAQADLTHPTGYGAQILGNWVYGALMQGYDDYQRRAPSTPAPP
jgi:lysophospholipase L1-like esterase